MSSVIHNDKSYHTFCKNINHQNKHGWSPLMTATRRNNLELVKLLLKKGADVNLVNQCGNNALNLACSDQCFDIVKYLLQNTNVNINHQNNHGWSPLMTAVCRINLELVKLLLKQGADVNLVNCNDDDALKLAIYNNDISLFISKEIKRRNIIRASLLSSFVYPDIITMIIKYL